MSLLRQKIEAKREEINKILHGNISPKKINALNNKLQNIIKAWATEHADECYKSIKQANDELKSLGFEPPGFDIEKWEHLSRIIEREPTQKHLWEIVKWAKAWIDRKKLESQLQSRQSLSFDKKPDVAGQNEERDKWIYEQCCKLVKYVTIINRLAKKKTWEAICTIQGIKLAANRYAARHDLPSIPPRQCGRKARK